MSVVVNGTSVNVVHVRHDGRSHELFVEDLNLGDNASSGELLTAVEDNLDLTSGVLAGYEVDLVASSGTAVVRPQAKFG